MVFHCSKKLHISRRTHTQTQVCSVEHLNDGECNPALSHGSLINEHAATFHLLNHHVEMLNFNSVFFLSGTSSTIDFLPFQTGTGVFSRSWSAMSKWVMVKVSEGEMTKTVKDIWNAGHIWQISLVFKGLEEGAKARFTCDVDNLFHQQEAGGLRGDYLRGFKHRLIRACPRLSPVSCRAALGGLRQTMHTKNGLSLILGDCLSSH